MDQCNHRRRRQPTPETGRSHASGMQMEQLLLLLRQRQDKPRRVEIPAQAEYLLQGSLHVVVFFSLIRTEQRTDVAQVLQQRCRN